MPETTKKILIVEDDLAMRDIVMHKLMSHGFTMCEAGDGKEGVETCLREKPDLILLDLMLPEMDGFKVLETIRGNPDAKLAGTPVIILSNLWSEDDIKKAKSLNIQGYMVKAYFTTEEIMKKINEVFTEQTATA